MLRFSIQIVCCLALVGCYSNDPRLPEELYRDALALNKEGRTLESKALMEEIVRRFPEKQEGINARQDLFMLEEMLRRNEEEERRQVRNTIRATTEALRRYRDRFGEYPSSLQRLVPDYGLDQIPVTPWGHPLIYRPYVSVPREEVADRRGRVSTRINTRFDSYHLACFGTDMVPGGEGMAADTLVVNGSVIQEKRFPPIPRPQPLR
jgi:hypothetical protein